MYESRIGGGPMATLKGEFEVTSWNEDAYAQRDDSRKLSRAEVAANVSGGVTGTSSVQWLMTYQADGTARFVGYQELAGELDGRTGSVVIESNGTFDGSVARGTWDV